MPRTQDRQKGQMFNDIGVTICDDDVIKTHPCGLSECPTSFSSLASHNLKEVDDVTVVAALPQLNMSVAQQQGEVVARHVRGFPGQEEDPVGGLRLKLDGQLQVAVGVGQGRQREVRLPGEVRGADRQV